MQLKIQIKFKKWKIRNEIKNATEHILSVCRLQKTKTIQSQNHPWEVYEISKIYLISFDNELLKTAAYVHKDLKWLKAEFLKVRNSLSVKVI